MRKIYLMSALVLLVWGCSQKTTPAKTTVSTAPAKDTVAIVAVVDASAGKETYTAKCGRCHGLKDPANYTSAEWVPILNGMAPKAHLSDAEKANVNAYVQANAKKG